MATFTESFDQPDSTTLGPDLTWTEVAGQWETIGGQAAMSQTGVNAYARPEVDTGSADMYVEAVIPTTAAFNAHYIDFQIMARMDVSAITGYCLVRGYWATPGGQFVMLRKYVNGVESTVTAAALLPAALPETWRLEVEGSDIRAYRDGVLVISGTDSTITTGTRAGLGGYQTTTDFNRLIRFDSFETGQLGAAPPENKTGTGHITQAHALTSAGTKGAYGTATLTQTHTITGTGHRVSDDRTGSGSIAQPSALSSSTGIKGGRGTAEQIDFYAMLTGTGEGSITKHATGTGHITQAHTSTATGTKGGRGQAAITQAHTATAGGRKGAHGTVALTQVHDLATTGTKRAAATGALTQAHTATATGAKGGRGQVALTQAHTITGVGAGEGQQASTGTGSITQGHTLASTGAKSARGRAQPVTVTTAILTQGVKGGQGVASTAQAHTGAATGYRGAYGTVSVAQVHTITGAGFNPSTLRDIDLTLGPLHTRGPEFGPLRARPFALAPLRR